jgi:hypothetical protein
LSCKHLDGCHFAELTAGRQEPETITTRVAAISPYSTNTVPRTTLAQDSIYDDGGAASGLLTLTALGSSTSAGYAGTSTLGVEQG